MTSPTGVFISGLGQALLGAYALRSAYRFGRRKRVEHERDHKSRRSDWALMLLLGIIGLVFFAFINSDVCSAYEEGVSDERSLQLFGQTHDDNEDIPYCKSSISTRSVIESTSVAIIFIIIPFFIGYDEEKHPGNWS